MRGLLLLLVQLTLSVLVVGLIMPAALLAFPATHTRGAGTTLAGTLLLIVFVLLRAAWPRPRAN